MVSRRRSANEYLPSLDVRQLVESWPAGRKSGPASFDAVLLDGDASDVPGARHVVLRTADEARARAWLARDATRVYLGEAALRDSALVATLADEFVGRVGVYAPARRMEVSWSLDLVSNSCFRVVTPSVCEPCWELLTADGQGTGTQLGWWLGEMFERGAAEAIVRADVGDDADFNILATLTERFGERLWVGPREQTEPDFAAWTLRAKMQRFAVPEALAREHPYFAALRTPQRAARRKAVA